MKKSVLINAFFTLFFCFGVMNAQVGINTTDPKSTLDINGNLSVKEIGIFNSNVVGSGPLLGSSGNGTPINDGVYISITPQGSNGLNNFLLPSAIDNPGRIYIVRNITMSNNAYISVVAGGGNLFAKNSNSLTPNFFEMRGDGLNKTLILISDGNNWTYFN